jgi:hypothetical protein
MPKRAAASSTRRPSGMTSVPMPSPAMTAMRWGVMVELVHAIGGTAAWPLQHARSAWRQPPPSDWLRARGRLGLRLFQRTTRRVSPTAEGETLCERAADLLRGFERLESELRERRAEPSGPIRLAATFGFRPPLGGPGAGRVPASPPGRQRAAAADRTAARSGRGGF